ncbi:MAG: DUF3768 domain-containing protein [Xanthobacteraceae bacterium]|uniref:DUF3768 domain-containing protein n=1 Tax=Pseudolabrys sp. TaxID=1960880 RepID=UPI003D14760D
MSSRAERIAVLNDQLRNNLGKGHALITSGVAALGDHTVSQILKAVASFDEFCEDNDPHGERDFGSLDVQGHSIFFKIDYYDLSMTMHSPDPADPNVTCRVMTLMLADEY